MLAEIKKSLELSSSDKDELLASLIKRCSQPILNYIGLKKIPNELEYIVIELVLARYNRLGSEGITSESVDGISYVYNSDVIEPYRKDLDLWICNNSSESNKKVKARLI